MLALRASCLRAARAPSHSVPYAGRMLSRVWKGEGRSSRASSVRIIWPMTRARLFTAQATKPPAPSAGGLSFTSAKVAGGQALTAVGGGAKRGLLAGVSGLWAFLLSNPLFRYGAPLLAGLSSLSIVLAATAKMQHKFTSLFRKALEYIIYLALFSLAGVGYVLVQSRRRLSMRAVHKKAFHHIRNMKELHSRLGNPVHISEKRVEIRSGGYAKRAYLKPGTDVNSLSWVQSKLLACGLPISYKYKKQRAHMVFPVMGRHNKEAMVSVEAVKRPVSDWMTPLGHYDFKLLAVDFADNTYMIVKGDQERSVHSAVCLPL